jgi:ribonuclease/clavin/mitogillin
MASFEFEPEKDLSLFALRSPTLPPATHTNCWVLGSDRLTLVDPGTPWTEELDGLMAWIGDRQVERIFLTHHHHDHSSGAKILQERTGAPIAGHPETASRVPFELQQIWEDGDILQSGSRHWTMVFTPGHARGHLCLHDPRDGTVIAGDMVAGIGTILLEPTEGDLGDYLSSLARLAALGATRLLPAHGPVLAPASDTVETYIAHRLNRNRQILGSLRALGGRGTAMELVPGVYTELDIRFHPIAGLQLSCHLNWLTANGVTRGVENDQYLLIDPDRLDELIEDAAWSA